MSKRLLSVFVGFILVLSFIPVFSVCVFLEFMMPGDMFWPESEFFLILDIDNRFCPALENVQLFVALTVGTGDYWFFPSWVQYPPGIEWSDIDVAADSYIYKTIIPSFAWPYGAGEFDGAMFLAAIADEGVLVSNLLQTTFGWSDAPPPPEDFVYIPPDIWTRGSPPDEPCRMPDEVQHQITLTQGFYMMPTEVTRQMWADLRADQPTLPADPSDTSISSTTYHPVQRVSWHKALLFANLMSVRDGFTRCYYKDAAYTVPVDATNYSEGTFFGNFDTDGYRLPTEAEWEYAARAGTTGPFSSHEPFYNSDNCMECDPFFDVLDSIAWWCWNAFGTAHKVATKLPNPWGLYDMHGNVQEWCWDWHDSYSSEPVIDPKGPSTGTYRMMRGGCWNSYPLFCRSADRRRKSVPAARSNTRGFRLARSAL